MRSFARIRVGALLAGIVLDHLAAPILLAPVTSALMLLRSGGTVPLALLDAPVLSQTPLLALGVVSCLSSFFGGYAAARIAGSAEILHGVLVGVGAIVVAGLSELVFPGVLPIPYVLVVSVPVVLAAGLGGRIVRRSRVRRGQPAT